MPIYEYHCPHCCEDFEKLVSSSTIVECPRCGATDLEKKFSVFGTSGTETGSSGSKCASCTSTNCKSCK